MAVAASQKAPPPWVGMKEARNWPEKSAIDRRARWAPRVADGLTPEAYLKRLRLLSARVKIRETEMPITDIAFLCGFSNASHVTSSYKRLFGVTPSQQRIAPRCPELPLAG